jgi:hypothetical protein
MVVAPKTTYKKKIRWKGYHLRKHKQIRSSHKGSNKPGVGHVVATRGVVSGEPCRGVTSEEQPRGGAIMWNNKTSGEPRERGAIWNKN